MLPWVADLGTLILSKYAIDRQVLARHQNGGLFGYQHDDRRKVVLQAMAWMLVQRHIDRGRAVAEEDLVTIRARHGLS